jgi:hypothetical protein
MTINDLISKDLLVLLYTNEILKIYYFDRKLLNKYTENVHI